MAQLFVSLETQQKQSAFRSSFLWLFHPFVLNSRHRPTIQNPSRVISADMNEAQQRAAEQRDWEEHIEHLLCVVTSAMSSVATVPPPDASKVLTLSEVGERKTLSVDCSALSSADAHAQLRWYESRLENEKSAVLEWLRFEAACTKEPPPGTVFTYEAII